MPLARTHSHETIFITKIFNTLSASWRIVRKFSTFEYAFLPKKLFRVADTDFLDRHTTTLADDIADLGQDPRIVVFREREI